MCKQYMRIYCFNYKLYRNIEGFNIYEKAILIDLKVG